MVSKKDKGTKFTFDILVKDMVGVKSESRSQSSGGYRLYEATPQRDQSQTPPRKKEIQQRAGSGGSIKD